MGNCYFATKVSFLNEMYQIADKCGVDWDDAVEGFVRDGRVGHSHMNVPGPDGKMGFGGSCFPKDVQALRSKAYEVGVEPHILNAVLKVNENQPYQVVELLKKSLIYLENKKILILGLAFKPGTDDVRESVSLKIINYLLKNKARIFAHDPVAIENTKKIMNNSKNIKFIDQWEATLSSVDAIVVVTKWAEYKKLSSSEYQEVITGKLLLDARRFFKPTDFPQLDYLTIGRTV